MYPTSVFLLGLSLIILAIVIEIRYGRDDFFASILALLFGGAGMGFTFAALFVMGMTS